MYYTFIEFIILLYTFFNNLITWYKEHMICIISFNKFSHVLTICTYAGAIGNLWSICLKVNSLSYFRFCCLLKLKFFSTISVVIRIFVFRIFFLLTTFLKSINALLTSFTIFSFLVSLELYINTLRKKMGFDTWNIQ